MTFILQASDKTITHRRACQQHVASLSTRSKTALPWKKKKSVGKHSLLCHKSRSLNSISYVSFSSVVSALISSLNCAVGKKKLDNFKHLRSPLLHCLWWWHVPIWKLTGLVPGEVQEHPSLPSWSVMSLLVTHTLLICSAEREALGTGRTSSSPLMLATDKALILDWWVRSVQ